MGIFRKQTARAPLTTVLLVLLLALSITASSIGFAAHVGAQKQSSVIEGEYTTIAVPVGKNFEKQNADGTYLIEDGNIIFDDGTKYVNPGSALKVAKESEHYITADNRILLSAHIPGTKNLSSGTMDEMDYSWELDRYVYDLSVIAVRCVDVQNMDTWYGSNQLSYEARFELLDGVCWVDSYNHESGDDLIYVYSRIFTPDGKIPFEPGKTYLIRGEYADYEVRADFEIVNDEFQVNGSIKDDYFTPRNIEFDPNHPFGSYAGGTIGLIPGWDNWTVEQKLDPETGMLYQCTPEENCWPYFSEYTGRWEDYLETEEGSVWKNEIIPYFERNHSSVAVILTDHIQAMYYFNTGTASVLDGRAISPEEQENGDKVCMVSAAYAQVNGLSVGDTLHMDFHNTGYTQDTYPVLQGTGRSGLTIQRYTLREESRIGYEEDYTIVGIYSAPEWEAGSQSFHADTVFVPKSSVPNAGSYGGESVTLLQSVILENGSVDAFEAYMAEHDMAGVYLYSDQGYSEAVNAVQILKSNSLRMMIVGVAMFMLASMLFLLLFARRVSAVMHSMRLLGVRKKGVWLESLGMLVMQESIAVLLGNGLAVILYDRITAQLLSGTPALDITSIALCAGVQLAVLIAAGGIWMHRIAGSNLMQKSEGGKLLWNKNKAASCGA